MVEALQALLETAAPRCQFGDQDTILIEVKKEATHAAVIFYSTVFQAFKEDGAMAGRFRRSRFHSGISAWEGPGASSRRQT
jgi:hypothetical protein